jgi:uncharacterized protein YxeA
MQLNKIFSAYDYIIFDREVSQSYTRNIKRYLNSIVGKKKQYKYLADVKMRNGANIELYAVL